MWSMFIYINSGRGRKSGVAHATAATPSLAPLHMLKLLMIVNFSTPNKLNHSTYFFIHIEYVPKNSKTKEIKFLSLE